MTEQEKQEIRNTWRLAHTSPSSNPNVNQCVFYIPCLLDEIDRLQKENQTLKEVQFIVNDNVKWLNEENQRLCKALGESE